MAKSLDESLQIKMNNDWEIKEDERSLQILNPHLGHRVTLSKVGYKIDGLIQRHKAKYIEAGFLSVIDRGGGPAIFVATSSQWFTTSWVLKAIQTDSGIEVETENSVYLITPH